jgi:putative transposase
MSRYRFIEAQREQHPVRLLCQVLGVPTSGYYAWQQAQQQVVAQGESAWEVALVKVFSRHQRRYGTRRLQVALRRKGYRVGGARPGGAHRPPSTQGLYSAHYRLDARLALRPEPTTQPAQAYAG